MKRVIWIKSQVVAMPIRTCGHYACFIMAAGGITSWLVLTEAGRFFRLLRARHEGGDVQRQVVHVLLVSVGYACFLALNSFSLWGFGLLPAQALGEQGSSSWGTFLSVSNALSFFVFAACSAVWPKRLARMVYPLSFALMAAALAGVLAFLFSGSSLFIVIGAICMGLATTCLFFCWIRVFAHEGSSYTQMEIIAGSVLSAVPFVAFLTLNLAAIALTLCILVVAVFAFFAYEMKSVDASELAVDPSASMPIRSVSPAKGLWRTCLCCFIIGIMAPVASALTDAVFVDMQFVDQVFMTHFENIVAAVVVGVSWFALKRKPDTVRAFTVLFPLLATVFLVFLFVPALRGLVPYVGGVAFVVCSMTVLVESASSASARGLDAGLMYGVCAGVLYASNAFGSLAMNSVREAAFDEMSMMLVVVVLLYGCSIVMFFITRKGLDAKEAPEGLSCEPCASDGGSESSDELGFSQTGSFDVYDDAIGTAAKTLGQSLGLTERQIQVFVLLAHGYTIPAAASAMYLSENTVRTHAKKIYAALGIHSKQELIELVAQAASGA